MARRTADRPEMEGRQYHIGLKAGEVAPYVLLAGDPARARKTAERFDKVRVERVNREFVTFTGTYHDLPVTVMSTGIGPDNMEIAVIELAQIAKNLTLLRIGSCGALRRDIKLGEMVVSTGAVRLENTSTYFVPEGYPSVANYELVLAQARACEDLGYRYHVGLTASAPGFYGAQGRKVPGFEPRFDIPTELAKVNVLNLEMEISALLTLASVAGLRAGAVCTVFANRPENKFIEAEAKHQAEYRLIAVGLRTFEVLSKMDERKSKLKLRYWLP